VIAAAATATDTDACVGIGPEAAGPHVLPVVLIFSDGRIPSVGTDGDKKKRHGARHRTHTGTMPSLGAAWRWHSSCKGRSRLSRH
jgi:hypothetical protein